MIDVVKMVKMSRDMKRRVSTVVWIAKTAFHWGFIPAVLYLGTVVSYSVQGVMLIDAHDANTLTTRTTVIKP